MAVANTTIRVTDRATASLANISRALAVAARQTDRLEAEFNQAGAASDRAERSMRSQSGAIDGLKSKLAGLVAAYVSVQTAQKFLAETDTYINNQARLKIMNDGLQTNAELYDKIYDSAQRSLSPVNDIAASVSKLGIVAKNAFANNDEIIGFVEIFNKAATVGGASQSEKTNAMYQLSQAFGSGRLQGDELRSVRENAPLLWKAIEKELTRQFGQGADFKKLAADGLISPDVIKRAAFASGKEIDKAFKNMPLSLGDIMVSANNKVKRSLEGVFSEMMRIYNNPQIKKAINTTTNIAIVAFHGIFAAVKFAAKAIIEIAQFLWKFRAVILTVITAMALYKTFTMSVIAIEAIHKAAIAGKAIIMGLYTTATRAATIAQLGLNVAALKFTLIALAIIAVVALAAYMVIKYLDNIVGAWYWLVAAWKNGLTHISNWMLAGAEYAVDAWNWSINGIMKLWLNMKLGFNNMMIGIYQISLTITEKIGGTFERMINPVIGAINKAIHAASMLPGLGSLANFALAEYSAADAAASQKGKLAALENANASIRAELAALNGPIAKASFGRNTDFIDKDAEYAKGKAKGASWQDSISNGIGKAKDFIFGGENFGDLDKKLGNVADKNANPYLKEIADNTGDTAKNTEKSKEEDYKMLRDVMAQRAVSRLGTSGGGTVKVQMTNNNNLSSGLDVSGFIRQLAETIEEAAATAAQGLHA